MRFREIQKILGPKMPHLPHFRQNKNFPVKNGLRQSFMFVKYQLQKRNQKKS